MSWSAAGSTGSTASLEIDTFDLDRSSTELHMHISALRAAMLETFEVLMLSSSQSQSPAPAPHVKYLCAPTSAPHQGPYQNTVPAYRQAVHPAMTQCQAPPHMSNWQSTGNPFTPSTSLTNTAPNRFAQALIDSSPSLSKGCGTRNLLGGNPVKDLVIAKHAAAALRTYYTTPAGVQQYQTDLAAWDATFAPSTGCAPDYTMFPLTPGILPVGSKECWSCGQITNPPHFGTTKCQQTGSTLVLQHESNVHALINNALFPPGECTPNCYMLFEEQEDLESGKMERDSPKLGWQSP
ncbi:hypothetical protein DFH09DRAFT_1105562 [Mycena vulgaris]|nr:hypothetical protein DFH09DRAFT_1105562 [Mycena vulgaris]